MLLFQITRNQIVYSLHHRYFNITKKSGFYCYTWTEEKVSSSMVWFNVSDVSRYLQSKSVYKSSRNIHPSHYRLWKECVGDIHYLTAYTAIQWANSFVDLPGLRLLCKKIKNKPRSRLVGKWIRHNYPGTKQNPYISCHSWPLHYRTKERQKSNA